MSSINFNINSLIAQRVSAQNNQNLSKSLERLSTGLAINRGSDNPAGLIASEKLRSDKAQLAAAIGNAERADQLVGTAEGGLQEISSLLTELQGLVSETANDAGLSIEEKEANQQQIDSILQTIDNISASTTFEGTQLLNGNFDFEVTGLNANVSSYSINGAKLGRNAAGTDNGTVAVNMTVTASAQHGSLFVSADGASLDLTAATDSFVFEVAGSKGTREFSFGSGETLANIATAVNAFKDATGVSAVASGNFLELKSTGYGSSEFVSFRVVNAGGQAGSILAASADNEDIYDTTGAVAFSAATNAVRGEGQDISALVNGVAADGKGRELAIRTDALDIDLNLNDTLAQAEGSNTLMTIAGGGAKFNLGPSVDIGNEVRLGIKDVASRHLGKTQVGSTTYDLANIGAGGYANVVDGNLEAAQDIVNNAIDEVSKMRGRLGAFQTYTVQSRINSMSVAMENIGAAESAIRDTDFAAETAALTRQQILSQASNAMLGIANSQPQSVLQLI